MAGADYLHCNLCHKKTLYDANVDYDNCDLGEHKSLCTGCAKTHTLVIIKRKTKNKSLRRLINES